jgi:integrase
LIQIDPKGEDSYKKYVPPEEDINAVLLAANQEEMDLLLTLYGTGAQISEVCRLTWEDVNLSNESITLWTRKRKGDGMQSDTLTMTGKLQKVMERRWKNRNKQSQFVFSKSEGSRYSKDSHFIKHMMPRLCKRARVKPFGYHAIRHKVASILMDSGKATLSNIQHFLRHKRPTTTENYLKSLNPGSQEMAGILDSYDLEQAKKNKKENADDSD